MPPTRCASEDVISAAGTVTRRAPENVNPNLSTGEIELAVSELRILADADTPPFPLDEGAGVDESLRLKYRALDLRRPEMQSAHRAAAPRGHDHARSAERPVTSSRSRPPTLTRSTPEGARDYLVPARIQPGSFYALPQSPQLFKQLLMIGGCERYYQIARCFRDEDTRADRQPEFTQLDLEMAFVHEDDVIETHGGGDERGVRGRRLRRGRPAMAPDDLRRGRLPLRHRSSRHAFRSGAARPRRGAGASHEFQVFASVLGDRRGGPGDQRRAARAARAPSSTRSPSWPSSTVPRAWCGRSSRRTAVCAHRSPSSSPNLRSRPSSSAWRPRPAICC